MTKVRYEVGIFHRLKISVQLIVLSYKEVLAKTIYFYAGWPRINLIAQKVDIGKFHGMLMSRRAIRLNYFEDTEYKVFIFNRTPYILIIFLYSTYNSRHILYMSFFDFNVKYDQNFLQRSFSHLNWVGFSI